MRRCAFLTMHDMTGFVAYDELVREPLARLGWSIDDVAWRSKDVVWSDYDVVVIRTTWDYQAAPAEFVSALEVIAEATQLENPLQTVRWNLRKTYLLELEQRGVRTVPTVWGAAADVAMLRAAFAKFETDQLVIKPEVGANADDAIWLRADDDGAEVELHRAAAVFSSRAFLLQPFVPSVLAEGEFSVIFFGGAYSHTVLKTPRPSDFRVQEEHGGSITAVTPEPALLSLATAAAAAVTPVPLYARADLVRMDDGKFALMELELIEPSLYLSYDDSAAECFAHAIVAYARSH